MAEEEYRLAVIPGFEVGDKVVPESLARDNDGSLIILARHGEESRRALLIPRVVRVKRGAPYDTPDPEQERLARNIVNLLNGRA